MKNKMLAAVIFLIPFFLNSAFADTVILKSGKQVEGKIVEDTQGYLTIETADGNSVSYNKNTIQVVNSPEGITSQLSLKTVLIDRSEKGYLLFIPKDVSSTLPSTFLVCLPGLGIRAKQDINNWAFYAAKNGFIVVALDVDYGLIRSVPDVDSLYLKISGILASLKNEYSLASNEVCIAGTSAGGMMSIALGLRYPDKFIAVGVVSGAKLNFGAEGDLKNARGKRFYIVHGGKDKIVPVSEFYSTKAQLEQNGAIVQSKVFPEGEHTLPSSAYQEVIDWLPKLRSQLK